MPSIAAHYYFGQEIVKRIGRDNSEITEIIHQNKAVFNLGLQGPDLLFYYRPYTKNKVTGLGTEIHSHPARDFINYALRNIREVKSNAALGYLMGLTCHFILDSSLHGEINEYAPEIRQHLLLEAEMDRQIIEENYSCKPHTFKRHLLVKTTNDKWDFLSLIYPQIQLGQLKECTSSICFYSKLLLCKRGIKKRLLELVEHISGKESPFTALIVDSSENKDFQPYAWKLLRDMKDITTEGVLAIKNVYDATRYASTLGCIFDRSFG